MEKSGNVARQVMDMRPSKGMSQGVSNEILRDWSDRGWEFAVEHGNYDRARTRLNFEIGRGGVIKPVDTSRSLVQRMADNLSARGIVDPNSRNLERSYRTLSDFIFSGSRERMREMAFGSQSVDFEFRTSDLGVSSPNDNLVREKDIENWSRDIYDFVCRKYGEENVLFFIVHLDETSPHIHCSVMPIDENNRFNYKKIFAGTSVYEYKKRTTELHNELAEINARWGLVRGNSISETKARHRTTEEYRRWLSEECSTLEQRIDNHKKALSELNVEIAIAEKRRKSFTTMVQNKQQEKEQLEKEILDLLNQKDDREVTNAMIEQKRQELEKVEQKLAERMSDMENAEETVRKLLADKDSINAEYRDLVLRNNSLDAEWSERATPVLSTVLFEDLSRELSRFWTTLTPEMQDYMEGSLIEEIASNGNRLITQSLLIMAGGIDEATNFAEGQGGGGGGGSDLKWGRDPDEDDREWARRCAHMARHMLRPSGGKRSRR